jgi:hypothetical protein
MQFRLAALAAIAWVLAPAAHAVPECYSEPAYMAAEFRLGSPVLAEGWQVKPGTLRALEFNYTAGMFSDGPGVGFTADGRGLVFLNGDSVSSIEDLMLTYEIDGKQAVSVAPDPSLGWHTVHSAAAAPLFVALSGATGQLSLIYGTAGGEEIARYSLGITDLLNGIQYCAAQRVTP